MAPSRAPPTRSCRPSRPRLRHGRGRHLRRPARPRRRPHIDGLCRRQRQCWQPWPGRLRQRRRRENLPWSKWPMLPLARRATRSLWRRRQWLHPRHPWASAWCPSILVWPVSRPPSPWHRSTRALRGRGFAWGATCRRQRQVAHPRRQPRPLRPLRSLERSLRRSLQRQRRQPLPMTPRRSTLHWASLTTVGGRWTAPAKHFFASATT